VALRRALAVLLLTLPTACARPAPADLDGGYAANGVTVKITVRAGRLCAAFAPDAAGFHLYSADLPPTGVDGLGFPTVLAAGRGLRTTGHLAADKPVTPLRPAGLDVELPVYPDGPVTLCIAVQATSGSPTAVIGYAACSATTCLMPVTGQPVDLHRAPWRRASARTDPSAEATR